MKHLLARCVALLCVVAAALVAGVATWPHASHVRTEDRNGDGRPDVWRHYDDHGQPTEVGIDTNFDGRSDVQEYYEHGTLVRRESDRNFDDRVDLIEDFDPATHEHVRSIVDIDYDGNADLLVLFHDGRPVFSQQVSSPSLIVDPLTVKSSGTRHIFVHHPQLVRRGGDLDRLAPLADPFRMDPSIRETNQASSSGHDNAGISTSGGLPESCLDAVSPVAPSARLVTRNVQPETLAHLAVRSPRGPPLS